MASGVVLALHCLFTTWLMCNAVDPLKWIAGSVGGSYYVGDTLVLNCSLNHPTLPVTLWYSRHKNDVFTQRIPDVHMKQTNQIFQIDAIGFNDSATYQCRATNVTPNTIGDVYISADGIPKPEPTIRWHASQFELGSDVILQCEGKGIVALTWFKFNTNGTMTRLTGGRIVTHPSPSGFTLTYNTYTIRHFREEDNGRYRCVLERPLVKWRASVDEIIESKKYEKPTFVTFPRSLVYVNEETYTNIDFRAKGSPRPSVRWYIVKADNSEELLANCPSEGTETSICLNHSEQFKNICGKDSKIVVHEGHIYINNACALYNIQLKAVVDNTVEQLNRTFRILVREKPKIINGNGRVSMYKSSRTTNVLCEVKPIFYPKVITFTWQVQTYSDSECLTRKCQPDNNKWITIKTPSNDYDTNSTGFKSVLTLKNNAKPLFIQCIARNNVSTHKLHWQLVILADARKLLESLKPKIEVDEGDNVTMTCEGDSTLLSSVIWKRGDLQIFSGHQYDISEQQKSKTDTIYRLKIDRANVSYGGMYKCIGMRRSQNPVIGNVSLVVHEFRFPAVQLPSKTVMQSTSFRMKCNATGHPKPEITWLKDGRPLRLGHSVMTSCKSLKHGIYRLSSGANSSDGNLLFCGSDYKTHAGIFTCTATNSLGNQSASARVRINAAPIIVGDPEPEYESDVGARFNLTCLSDGSPRPDISWQKKIDDVFEDIEPDTGSELVFPEMTEEHFGVYRCIARNLYGDASWDVSIVAKIQTGPVIKEVGKASKSVSIAIGVFVAIMIIASIVVVIVLYRRKKEYGGFYVFTPLPLQDYIKKLDPHKPIIEQTNKLPYDAEWEFPRNRLKFSRELGSGAFGKVFLAEALGIVAFDPRGSIKRRSSKRRFGGSLRKNPYVNNNKMTKVAVKTLKEDSGEAEYKDLLSELKILIHVGEHKNIVNLLGACTKGRESELWVIIEFCLNGNLLQFLRNRRDIYEPEWKVVSKDPNMQLTMTDLVIAAYQIARGMEFLASRMCIHRDLATRNILVTDNYIIKIADFGLARDVGTDSQYIKTSTGLLPVKWMAIEAIIERLFTEKSDVWSFGIVLWELFTLGGTPYPNIPANEISEYLALGNRMCPPHACPEEISSLMNSCWQDDRDDRPSFKELVENLDKIIELHTSSEDGCGYLEVTCDGFINDYLRPSEIKSPQMDPFELNSPLPPLPSPGDNEHDALLQKDQNSRRKLFDFDKSIKNKAARHDSELEKVEKDSEPERIKDISREGSDVEIDGYIDTSLTGKERERLEQDHDKDRDSSEEPRLSDSYAYWKKSSV